MALTRVKWMSWATIALCLALTSGAAAPASAGILSSAPFCCRNAPPWRGFAGFGRGRDASFLDVAAISRNDAWAVGDTYTGTATTGGIAVHWNGKAWRPVPVPLKRFVPVSVSARGDSSAWIFGYQDEPGIGGNEWPAYGLQWVRGSWHVHRLPSALAIWDVLGDLQAAVISNTDVWVIGNGETATAQPADNLAWNWTGASWVRHPLQVAGLRSISASSSSNVWVAGEGRKGRTFALRWNGAVWRRVRIPNLTDASVVDDSAHNVWLAGSVLRNQVEVGAVTQWNGRRWSARSVIPSVQVADRPASTDWRGGLWFGQYAHETGGTWYVPTALPSLPHCGLGLGVGVVAAVPGTSAAWFAGACFRSGRLIPMIAIDGHL